MDLTLVLMQQLIRVTYFAWSLQDMTTPVEKLPPSAVGRVLKETPSLLDFLCYNMNFLGMMCPSPEFSDYMDFIHRRGNYQVTPLKMEDHLILIRNIVIAIVVHVLGMLFLISPHGCLTSAFANHNILVRYMLINIAAFNFRSRYYVPWLISQLSIDLAGLSYNSKSGKFDLYENARPLEVEFLYMDSKRRVTVWNMGTQKWLKSIFYERFEQQLGKSTAALATFAFSAFWHGFYPSYYVAFFYVHMCGEIQKMVYKNQDVVLGPFGTVRRPYVEKALE